MIREFISWLGLFTESKQGNDIISDNGIQKILFKLIVKNG